MEKSKTQIYPDGVIEVLRSVDQREPGNQPKLVFYVIEHLHAAMRTVGEKRFYDAMANNMKVDLLVRTPLREHVTTRDRVRFRGREYKILQIQYPIGVAPSSMDLSLEEVRP